MIGIPKFVILGDFEIFYKIGHFFEKKKCCKREGVWVFPLKKERKSTPAGTIYVEWRIGIVWGKARNMRIFGIMGYSLFINKQIQYNIRYKELGIHKRKHVL